MTSAFLLLIAIFSMSIVFAAWLGSTAISDELRGNVACFLDGTSCTRCQFEVRRCPEWSDADVVSVIQTQAKSSATLAAIFFAYAFGAIRFGFKMRTHISTYQIEYV